MNNQLIVLVLKDFFADFEKQDGRHRRFSTFFLHFSSSSYSGCVIATVFKFSGQISYYKRLLKNIDFGACVCVYVCTLARWAKFTFGPLQQILF